MPSGAGWKTLSYVRLPERNSRKKGLKFRKKNLMVNILTILTFEKSLEGFILFIPHLEVSWLHAFHFSLRKKMWLRSGEQARIILHLLNKLLLCKDCWPLAKVQQFEDITRLPRKWSISSARIERAPPPVSIEQNRAVFRKMRVVWPQKSRMLFFPATIERAAQFLQSLHQMGCL